jgi:hypothetical protein
MPCADLWCILLTWGHDWGTDVWVSHCGGEALVCAIDSVVLQHIHSRFTCVLHTSHGMGCQYHVSRMMSDMAPCSCCMKKTSCMLLYL